MEDPTPAGVDLLVTLARRSHGQCGVHVDVVTGEIETDQALEDDTPARKGGSQKDQQTGCGAAVGHHIEYGTECGGLVVSAGCDSVGRIEKAGYAIQTGAGPGMQRHVVERSDCEDNSGISWRGQLVLVAI